MVAVFNRSFSLPGSPRPKPDPKKSYHVRSISLPCRSHPLISQLEDDIRSVTNWVSSAPVSASYLCDGLSRLDLLHTSLNDLLNLPQSQDSLRRGSGSEWTDRILNDFLRLADAHGCFRSELITIAQQKSDAQVAIRIQDKLNISLCTRSIRKSEKELVKIASSLKEISKSQVGLRFTNGVEEAELAGVIREVISVTVSALAAVFLGVADVASTATGGKNSSWTPLRRLSTSKSFRGLGEESSTERFEVAEERVRGVESKSESLFRCLVNIRVSLLNILTC
ncbi:uncharacterized protein LOC109850952 [Asparagus officinalis]|uniref:uncharacterized protein LOC109850952 n=1 Tax=Asparagus officinalis TaxID=4686 RepID=UPI00098DE2B0|nr:uncharacterized protein LOC109850952 [Asparagus officinalis]